MIGIGILGCGRWGVNYIRVFEELVSTDVKGVYDPSEISLRRVRERFPSINTVDSVEMILDDRTIDAVIVATPATTHYELVRKALFADKHVLVEKPVALRREHTEEIIELACMKKKVLMVGHTFLFNAGIRRLKEYIKDPSFGKIYYMYSTRTNMGPIRKDVNALWDLAPHDISIFNFLVDTLPEWVSATGTRLFNNGREDVGFVTLGYNNGIIANIHVSWADPYKVREVVVVGSKRRIMFDDLENLERIRIFEKGVMEDGDPVNFGEFRLLMRDGDIISPRIENTEPLKEQCRHFVECITEGKEPISDGSTGLQVIDVMLAVNESLNMQGVPVRVRGTSPEDSRTRPISLRKG